MAGRKSEAEREGDGRPMWDDPSIPVGNSPPLAAWPLWVSAALWGGWICVLVVLAVTR